jgi:hypothetical protein
MFNREADQIARIEALELEVRQLRRRIEHAPTLEDKRVLDRQLGEAISEIGLLKERLSPRPPRLAPSK